MNRRGFLKSMAVGAACVPAAGAYAEPGQLDAPPKSTSGDNQREPDWNERFSIRVGPGGDIEGTSGRAIQAAVDYCARLGGGTVRILPGTYTCRNSIFLPSGTRVTGERASETILQKSEMVKSGITKDSDWFDQEITLADASGFNVGDGVCLTTKNPHHGGLDVFRRTLIARNGNRFKLDEGLRKNFWTMQEPTVATLFPIFTAEYERDITISDLVVDGNKANNENLNGNYGGGLWFQDCSGLTFSRIESRNYNGDGFSWQICHDVIVDECYSHDNEDLGMHPGSGSQRSVIRNCTIEDNNIGIFFCWGDRECIAENNRIRRAATAGISIGHRDHYNIVRGNTVEDSGSYGVLFRPERGEGFTATGNLFEKNIIRNSGGDDGVGVEIQGVTAGNTIARNTIEETRGPAQRIGIRIGAETGDNTIDENAIDGFAQTIVDLRKVS